jgi:hypothetical protein
MIKINKTNIVVNLSAQSTIFVTITFMITTTTIPTVDKL